MESAVATPSAFAEWVYKQRFPYQIPNDRAGLASIRERHDGLFRSIRTTLIGDDYYNATRDNWETVYCDIFNEPSPLPASRLAVNGQRFFCKPDFVRKNNDTGEINIVELKTTEMRLREGEADFYFQDHHCAQAWCYGEIDLFSDAPVITIQVDLWLVEPGVPEARCKGNPIKWIRGTGSAVESRCAALFSQYKCAMKKLSQQLDQ